MDRRQQHEGQRVDRRETLEASGLRLEKRVGEAREADHDRQRSRERDELGALRLEQRLGVVERGVAGREPDGAGGGDREPEVRRFARPLREQPYVQARRAERQQREHGRDERGRTHTGNASSDPGSPLRSLGYVADVQVGIALALLLALGWRVLRRLPAAASPRWCGSRGARPRSSRRRRRRCSRAAAPSRPRASTRACRRGPTAGSTRCPPRRASWCAACSRWSSTRRCCSPRPAGTAGGASRRSSPSAAGAVLEGWRTSRWFLRRLVFTSLRAIVTQGYFADAAVLRALGLAPLAIEAPVTAADTLYPPIGRPKSRDPLLRRAGRRCTARSIARRRARRSTSTARCIPPTARARLRALAVGRMQRGVEIQRRVRPRAGAGLHRHLHGGEADRALRAPDRRVGRGGHGETALRSRAGGAERAQHGGVRGVALRHDRAEAGEDEPAGGSCASPRARRRGARARAPRSAARHPSRARGTAASRARPARTAPRKAGRGARASSQRSVQAGAPASRPRAARPRVHRLRRRSDGRGFAARQPGGRGPATG